MTKAAKEARAICRSQWPAYYDIMPQAIDHPERAQHLTMDGVSWAYYEHTLEQIGDRPIRVSFLDGSIEIMSPLPEHESFKKAIAQLIEAMTFEFGVPRKSFGSTTFRHEEKSAGTEPDECYYFHDIDAVKGMKRFDPLIHPAPDLAVEIDILSPSIPREPIYARLGVPEIWRYNGKRLDVRVLSQGLYGSSVASRAFPSLPMERFASFIEPMIEEDEIRVLRRFRDWLRTISVGSQS